MRRFLPVVLTIIAAFVAACGGTALHPASNTSPASASPAAPASQPSGQTGTAAISFPKDGVQPWEKLDGAGHVIPVQQDRSAASALGANSQFAKGSERFLEGGGFSNFGSATKLSSPAGGAVAYAMYRFVLGGAQPGVVTVDANLHGAAKYYVAVSNFQLSHWEWYGPYSDAQVTLPIALASATSNLGNTFVTVAAFDNAELDIVGVGVTPRDAADTTAPPAPSTPVATPVTGGLELTWIPVVAGDLAGYRVYYGNAPFTAPGQNGVQSLPWLEGTTRLVLPLPKQRLTFVALSAVDASGNASALSPTTSAVPLTGAMPAVQLTTSLVSGGLNDAATLSATGASSYDFDLDGDGVFEVTGNTSGSAQADTSRTGIIRPRVRATGSGGTAVALGSVSLIISGNQPPHAIITAQGLLQGAVPFIVNLSGTKSSDPDGTIVEYAWDDDSDGVYDSINPTDPTFSAELDGPGTANLRLRVTDNAGAWGVDSIVATGIAGNLQLFYEPSLQQGQSTFIVPYYPGPENVVSIDWDLNGDGTVDETLGPTDQPTFGPVGPGQTQITATATLDSGGAAYGIALITVHGWYVYPYVGSGSGVSYISGGVCGGLPSISFIDSTGQLTFMSAQNIFGTAWNTPVTPVPAATAVRQSMVMLSSGRVGIAYLDTAHSKLGYTYALDDTGSTWSAPASLETNGINASSVSTALIGGNPAVAYYHSGLQDPLFVRANDALGTAWAGPNVISAAAGSDGQRICLAEIGGLPAVAYASGVTTLMYASAKNVGGTAWNTPVPAGVLNNDSSPLALASIEGYPSIAFVANAFSGQALWFLAANAPDGTDWSLPATIVDFSSVDSITAPAMREVGGVPWIAYARDGVKQMLARANAPVDPGWELESCCAQQLLEPDATSGFFALPHVTYVATADETFGTATLASKF